jgi:ABC-type sugar transport system substrate-binding protein
MAFAQLGARSNNTRTSEEKMNRFSRICLLVIALSLAVIALRAVARPKPVAAAGRYKYLVIITDGWPNSMQAELDKQAAAGWELATPVVSEQPPGVTLIFRKSDQ